MASRVLRTTELGTTRARPATERLRPGRGHCKVVQVPEDTSRSRASLAMDRYADGDDGAFVEVYDELAPKLLMLARSMLRSVSTAEDVVQQTFLQIHQARATFVRGAPVEPWAYTITRRAAITWMRRQGRRLELAPGSTEREHEPADELSPSPERNAATRELDDALANELLTVPETLRSAFVMLRLEGLSATETGNVLGVTQAAAKVRAHRAGRLLRTRLSRFFARESS